MEKLIVYVDDAAHAMGLLQPLLAPRPGQPPRQWIVVACAPRVTHHVSKWVTHRARESWRGKWADKLFSQLQPWLQCSGDAVLACIGRNNLGAQTDALLAEHGPARVIDARRPRQGLGVQPEALARSAPGGSLQSMCLTLMGAGMGLALE